MAHFVVPQFARPPGARYGWVVPVLPGLTMAMRLGKVRGINLPAVASIALKGSSRNLESCRSPVTHTQTDAINASEIGLESNKRPFWVRAFDFIFLWSDGYGAHDVLVWIWSSCPTGIDVWKYQYRLVGANTCID